MRIETAHPKFLDESDIARWRALQAADPDLASPCLTPEWARIIGEARPDARICIIEDGAAYFGAQRMSRFTAMGLGAPISDYQGMIAQPGLHVDAAALCRALKVGRIDLTHVPAGQTILDGAVAHSEGSWISETAGGRAAYEANLKAQRAEFVRQTDKKLRKLTKEHGEVRFAVSRDRADFEALLAWKRAQLELTGQPAIWDTPWVRQVIDACFDAQSEHFAGLLFTMHVGDRLAAANFCVRSASAVNMWIIAHVDAFEAGSPGVQLARWVIGWAGDQGLDEVDFGPGEYRYKRQLATTQRQLEWGVASGLSFSGAVRRTEYALRAKIERLPSPKLAALPGKAMRRIDLMRALAA